MENELLFSKACAKLSTFRHRSYNHGRIDVKKFKVMVNQFLGQDDEHWMDSIQSLSDKFDSLIKGLTELRDEMVVDKKLRYALQWDESLLKLMKKVVREEYGELSCEDVDRVKEYISKPRKINPMEIGKLTNALSQETKLKASKLLENVFKNQSTGKQPVSRTRDTEIEKQREREKVKEPEVERTREQHKYRRERIQSRSEVSEKTQGRKRNFGDNGLPILKVKDIRNLRGESYFNTIIKLQKIIKTFTLRGAPHFLTKVSDQTGQIDAVLRKLVMVKPGASLAISNAKLYEFKGTKQIQMQTHNCWISDEKDIVIQKDPEINENKIQSRRENREDRPRRRNRDLNEKQEGDNTSRRPNRPVKERRNIRKRYSSDQNQEDAERRPYQQPKRQRRRSPVSKETSQKQAQAPPATKINKLQPGDQNLNLFAEVLQIIKGNAVIEEEGMVICRLVDDTAMVRAKLPSHYAFVKEGAVLFLKGADADVDLDNRITVRLRPQGKCQTFNATITHLNTDVDMSHAEWMAEDSEEEEGKKAQRKKPNNKDKSEVKAAKINPPPKRESKPISNWTKIQKIEPMDEDLNILAEVYELIPVPSKLRQREGFLWCQVADETAIVRAELPNKFACIKEGAVIILGSVSAEVDSDTHITLRLSDDGFCETSNKIIDNLNTAQDISATVWEQEEEPQQAKEKIIEDL